MTEAGPPAPFFPPAFTGHALRAGCDPLASAFAAALNGTCGAGDLFWSQEADRAVAMFILEPDGPLAEAVQMGPTLMVALGDALGAIGPPNLALTFRWPFTVLANGARVGRVVIAAPDGAAIDDVPSFLIVGFELVLFQDAGGTDEPGSYPDVTALHEEGAGDIDRTALIEAVSRHFLSWIDGWQQDGFRAVHQSWIARAHDCDGPVEGVAGEARWSGRMLGLDEEGGLILRENGKTRSIALASALERACG